MNNICFYQKKMYITIIPSASGEFTPVEIVPLVFGLLKVKSDLRSIENVGNTDNFDSYSFFGWLRNKVDSCLESIKLNVLLYTFLEAVKL